MNVTGTRQIAAEPGYVWDRLNDPEVLKQCISGCESMHTVGDGEFVASLRLKFGPVSAAFDGKLSLSNIVDNRSYTITFEGLGGIAGHGRGIADVRLESDGDITRLIYAVEAVVGGKVAQIGRPLVKRIARRMIDDFFDRFEASVDASINELR